MFSKRLKSLRLERGFTQTALAGRLGVSQQAIAKWEAARALPEPALLARLASLLEVSADYLLGITNSLSPVGALASVRVIGTVKAGYGGTAFEDDLGCESAAVRDADEYRYLAVRGDSMSPYIREGDLALVKLQSTLQNGDLGVVIYGDGEATLKKYYRDGNTVRLEPLNPDYDTLIIRGEDLRNLLIFGKVIETHTRW